MPTFNYGRFNIVFKTDVETLPQPMLQLFIVVYALF